MQVKFGEIAREYREIRPQIDSALAQVLERGWFVLGPEVEAFEAAFAAYLGIAHCVACASGTEAIALALMAIDVGPGDEVITVAHTAVPTATGIEMTGARPVFVDITENGYLMDVGRVEAAITPGTRAILPVHLYGQCVDMAPLLALAARRGVPVVEDCAQAHGATYQGHLAGSLGLLSAFSFYPSKNLGCYGDGGAVVTANAALAERLRMLRNYGQRRRYYHEIKGINSRLDEIQATILRTKLPHLQGWNDRRRQIALRYSTGLQGLPLRLPVEAPYGQPVYHLYVVGMGERDRLQAALAERGVQTLVHYPVPVHLQAAYALLGYQVGDLPVTERAAASVLSLPMYPQLSDEEVDYVVACMRATLAG